MNIKVPDYFTRFRCKADKCLDSCCIGWEIAVDEESVKRFSSFGEGFYSQFCENSCSSPDGVYIKTDCEGRCPYLDERSLCKIITEHGEGAVPYICREHPRYYNAYPSSVEGGIGLCCEEGARLILESGGFFDEIHTEKELAIECEEDFLGFFVPLYELREKIYDFVRTAHTPGEIISGLWHYASSLTKHFDLASDCTLPTPSFDCGSFPDISLLFDCEFLDTGIKSRFENATRHPSYDLPEEYTRYAKALCCYFLHRYFLTGYIDGSPGARLGLSALVPYAILSVTYSEEKYAIPEVAEVAKDISKSIEYSTENEQLILDGVTDLFVKMHKKL